MEFLLGIVLVGLSLIMLPAAADPFQPVRALVAGIAVVGAVMLVRLDYRSASLKAPVVLVVSLAALYLAAAFAGHAASSLFGVHGRYQGLAAGALYVGVGLVGAAVFGRSVFALVWPLAGISSVHGLILLVQQATGADPVSSMGNQVLAGGWLATATAVVFSAALVSTGRRRTILSVAAAVSALGVGVCGSRGAWFALAIAVVAAVVVLRSRRSAAVLAGVAVAALLGAAVLGGPAALSKLDPSTLAGGSAASRWQIWKGSVAMIAANPVLGVGPGRFLYEFPRFEPFERAVLEYGDVRADQAHSELLQVAAEAGVPASLVLLALIGLALVRGYRAARAKDGAAFIAFVGLCAVVAQGIFGITTVESGVLAWVLGGIAITRTPGQPRTGRKSEGTPVSSTALRWVRATLVITGAAVAVSSGVYLAADTAYGRGMDLFAAGQLDAAVERHQSAQHILPVVDTFRVAEYDAAAYLGGTYLETSLDSLEEGLGLEPASYDLALARARALKLLERPISEVTDAYVSSVELFPLGVEVRTEAVQLLYAANRDDEAAAMERDLVRLQQAAGRGTAP
jgi:O-antigen ligase